jgi:hypothetical protein
MALSVLVRLLSNCAVVCMDTYRPFCPENVDTECLLRIKPYFLYVCAFNSPV